MIEQQPEEEKTQSFNSHYPAIELPTKNYSLQADMVTGWRPKLRALGPIPFNFDSRVLDQLIDELTSFGRKYKQRVIYLGNRYASSFQMHKEMTHEYRFKHDSAVSGSLPNMAAYFKKFHSNFKSKNSKRIFTGMNPTIKTGEQVVFDSEFESGNLDAVIKVGEGQFDLFMRVDTNTRGHVQWFNFTVKNFGKKKIRLNIVNFKKYKTLYSRDMRPFIYSENLNQTKGLKWHQGGENVTYLEKKKLRYSFLEQIFVDQTITYNCLRFDYTFQTEWETVHFAYCAPFTYSQTLSLIQDLKNQMKLQIKKQEEYYLQEENLCESLGGLDIPLITVTDPTVDDKQKRCILVSARIHPGQTCGSHMVNGLLKYLCSEDAKELRKVTVFKIIPMINPDGVVIGNFRTSLCGRDLNRQFRTSADFLIPEVKALKQLVIKLKGEFKSRLIFFLDFHGHSVKKNVFLYGPDYEIWETNYYKTRIFPKIMASKTQIFRYYSCVFRVADFKRTTARAVILNTIPFCYTVEASVAFFYSPEEKRDVPFTPESWGFMGRTIGESIKDYMDLMYDHDMSKKQRSQKINELKTHKVANRTRVQRNINSRNGSFQTRLISVSSSQKNKQPHSEPRSHQRKDQAFEEQMNSGMDDFSQKIRDIIEQIKRDQMMKLEKKVNKDEQGQENSDSCSHESDNFSEGGSDSEGQSDDIPEDQLKMLHEQILDSMKEFRKNFYNKSQKRDRNYSMREDNRKESQVKQSQQRQPKLSREVRGIQMIPSLRKKAEKLDKINDSSNWGVIRSEARSFTSNVNLSTPQRERTKISFKTYLEQIDKDKIKKQSKLVHSEFLDKFSKT